MEITNAFLSIKNLIKYYENKLILFNIDITLNKGDIVSIIGPSGCGKTTLLKCIIGLTEFQSMPNSIQIDNMNSKQYLQNNRISYVPQKFANYEWLNVQENIMLGLAKKFNLFSKNKINNQLFEILHLLDLTEYAKYPMNKLSGGMQQRVAIGRALAQDTDIIALDEPFGTLDFKIREELQIFIKKINKTILFVTHDIEEALFIGNKIIVLNKNYGKIVKALDLQFRNILNSNIKFEPNFIELKKEIQDAIIST